MLTPPLLILATDEVWRDPFVLSMRGEGLPVALADDPAKPVWIQVAKTGHFKGHGQGEFAITTQTFADIVRNFKATENHRIPIDFEHASEQPASEGSIPNVGAPAQGWIVDLKVEGNKLMALVEWGELAREYIKTGKYKYISPAIRFHARDRESGKPIGAKMSSAGLTNQPFLDGMMPLAAKDTIELKPSLERTKTFQLQDMLKEMVHASALPELRYAMRMPHLSTYTEMLTQTGRLREMCRMADHSGMCMGVKVADYMQPMASALRMPVGSTYGDVLDAVEALIKAEMAKHNLERHGGASMKETHMLTDAEKLAKAEQRIAELENKVKTTEGERDAARGEVKTLTEIKDNNAKVFAACKDRFGWKDKEEPEVAALLMSEIERRDDEDAKVAVDEAFAVHCKGKDEKILKPRMIKLYKSDPTLFSEQYPKVAPDKKHLLQKVTPEAKDGPRASLDERPVTISMRELAHQISREKKIPLGDAQILAQKQIREMRRQQAQR